MAITVYTNISELVTNRGVVKKGGVGITEDDLGIIQNAALVLDSKKGILWLGLQKDLPKSYLRKGKKASLEGKILIPALVDCHTHLVFAGSRDNEFKLRLQGYTYQEIAAMGGGIVSSVKHTRNASEQELFTKAKNKIELMQKFGVGILEVKSGYGLNWAAEKKQLQVAAKLKKHFSKSLILRSTFMGAHAFPPEATTARDKINYATEVADKMLPLLKKENLADAVDIFQDEGYFTRSQSRRILQRAARLGFDIKIHADELADTGAAKLAAELGCLSADHLLKANEEGLSAMANRGVVAVLLPATAFYLGIKYASVEKMRRVGVCMALATDYNPGSSPTLNLPFVMSLACMQMGMTTAEAFAAVTYGGAKALGLHDQHGYLKIGGKPKMAILNTTTYVSLISQMSHPGFCEKII